MLRRGVGFWVLQVPGWLLLIYLIYAQGVPALDYDLGVAMGTQEPAEQITEVGAAFWWGFAFGDLVMYIPLLSARLIGHLNGKVWGRVALTAALGITAYWPVVALAAVTAARDAAGWSLPKDSEYWLALPLIASWAVWGLWRMKWELGRPVR
jgi:hypothetical protein